MDPLRFVLETTGAERVTRTERIQSLWGGYGDLLRVHLHKSSDASVVVKWAKPPARAKDTSDVAHRRKCRSYDVELAFYRSFASLCDDRCRVARCLGSWQSDADHEWILVLEDLDAAGFSRRDRRPRAGDLTSCLAWLASFHARFVGHAPTDLWPVGSYWHLETRRHELVTHSPKDQMHRALAHAEALDGRLRECRYQTFVHGDAKPANFCFSRAGSPSRVAAVDFQYVGGGPGIVDVAYLLHGSSRAEHHPAVVTYFDHLRAALARHAPTVGASSLEAEWRDLLPVAISDFERFLAYWRG